MALATCFATAVERLRGIASSLLYALMIWGIGYEGYNPISRVPSELTAIGAPTRGLWAGLGWIDLSERTNISVFLFWVVMLASALWRTARAQRKTRRVSPISAQVSRG
jgi:hypothetical protein